ncbi:MAG: hypothetical protein QM795_09055 [Pseudoxanthomonas sp.]
MLMGLPVAALPTDGAMDAGEHFQCFDIEVEIAFWMSNIERLKWSPLEAERSVLIELIKFAYDGYILYGGVGQESSWMFLMTRFKASKLSRSIRASYAETVFTEIWSRVYGG